MRNYINRIVLIIAIVGILSSLYASAAPTNVPAGPDVLSVTSSSRYVDRNASVTVEAEAGNITVLIINDTRSTQTWQGYYGNVTGSITLADGSNYTLYSWSSAAPTGEIYAANKSTGISWASVQCLNLSQNSSAPGKVMNATTLENDYSINETDRDGFNETFEQTYLCGGGQAACFKVGSVTIPNNTCRMVTTYVDNGAQTSSFKEVLLYDNVTSTIIFTALLENDVNGFMSGSDPHDFQMIVVENGHPGFELTNSNYYFYVELA